MDSALKRLKTEKIPIIPLVISNYDHLFYKKTKTFKSGTMKVTVLPPVSTEGLTADDVGSLTDRVRQQMLQVYHEGDTNDNTKNDLKEKSE
ncbi:hypothetical protein QZH41_009548 [Actinostola sp. cb2023]|nr:hypothetical protein QZH41_009548 [Actinostola sp. cb2023]